MGTAGLQMGLWGLLRKAARGLAAGSTHNVQLSSCLNQAGDSRPTAVYSARWPNNHQTSSCMRAALAYVRPSSGHAAYVLLCQLGKLYQASDAVCSSQLLLSSSGCTARTCLPVPGWTHHFVQSSYVCVPHCHPTTHTHVVQVP